MTVQVIQSRGHNGWTVRCDLCEHRFDAAVAGKSAAVAFARINGWVVGETIWCPMCATARITRIA
ncbi:hypothetical protein CJ179_34750 [Rhodococcus sp. ACS1]|uniref:hypothetical protein n=1 Tax=Rhodococcus sp. ACS1 TaxID=2028570 RepID=UPI000BB166DC|nr:hypothetical protein [Rhodococcus sp. ACS1]PBC39230.1 hypothetical protein CJ179_34750 [Rhodococcus sp. ACS1]